jgi:probable F420-dependent oxidoreductase
MAAHKPFRFGVGAGPAQSRPEWVAAARKIEALGYSTMVMGEHLGFAEVGGMGPIAGLMAAADATTTLRLGSAVFNNDFRHPYMLAQEAATIDMLSDGRLELGLGGGWLKADYDVSGVPFDPPALRIERLEEAVTLIKRLYGDEPVTFAGRHYQVQDLNLFPKPTQRPHPPIFIGGGGRRVLTLAAREADIVGLDPKGTAAGTKDLATTTAQGVDEQLGWLRAAAGERFDSLELHILVFAVEVTDDRRRGAERVAEMVASIPSTIISNAPSAEQVLESPQFLVGTIAQIVDDLQERRERYGISYITVFAEYVDVLSPVVAQLAGK